MKKILILAAMTILASCSTRYTQQSPEIEMYKKVIAAYEKQQFDDMAQFYADSAKIMNNVPEKEAQTIAQLIALNKNDAALFSSWDYLDKDSEYEMVVTDKGETWVNFWGTWQGKLKANGKSYTIPTAITVRFVDGKIVREIGYWDLSKVMLDLAKLDAVAAIEQPDKRKEQQ